MLELGLSSDYERLEILGKQLQYKYPKGKTLTDEEARDLAKEQIEELAREYGRAKEQIKELAREYGRAR